MKDGKLTIRIKTADREKYVAVKEALGANSDSETVSKMSALCWTNWLVCITAGTPENLIAKELRAQVLRDKDRNQTVKRERRND